MSGIIKQDGEIKLCDWHSMQLTAYSTISGDVWSSPPGSLTPVILSTHVHKNSFKITPKVKSWELGNGKL